MSVFMPLFTRPAAVRALRDCYEILGDLTPLKSNCGKLCGAACCESDETGENGMLLFPMKSGSTVSPFPIFLSIWHRTIPSTRAASGWSAKEPAPGNIARWPVGCSRCAFGWTHRRTDRRSR